MRHPAVAAGASTVLLVVLALPVLNMHTKLLSFTDLPKSLSIVQTYDTIQASFPGSQDPAHLVVKADDVTTPRFSNAYAEFKKRALATGVIHQPIRVSVNQAKTVARVDFPLAGEGQDATAVRALETLRTQVIPPVLATLPPGTQQAVTGDTAANVDFNQTMKSRAPIVFAFVLGFAFLLLLLTFRSIVIPIKAIILNLLSVGAAYGVLVWIFQYGHLQGLLGFHSNGAVVTWLPLFLFAVLFGLSMDYHVFILSRVKELVDQGVPTDQAVERGIRSTASTVTSAAAVMIAIFAIFASLQTLDIKQLGVGLAVAVLLDATLIRGVLLPATMKLLGDWNWYLPRWLEWMPRLSAGAKTARGHSQGSHPDTRRLTRATERFCNGNQPIPLSAATHRRALAAAQPRALAGQVAAGDPALHRALLPLDRLRRRERDRVLRDPVHRPLPAGAVRLQRRRPALVLARRLLQLQRARHRPLPAVHAQGRAATTRPGSRSTTPSRSRAGSCS